MASQIWCHCLESVLDSISPTLLFFHTDILMAAATIHQHCVMCWAPNVHIVFDLQNHPDKYILLTNISIVQMRKLEVGISKTRVLDHRLTLSLSLDFSILICKLRDPPSFPVFLRSLKPSKWTPYSTTSADYTPRVCRPVLVWCKQFLSYSFSLYEPLVLSYFQVSLMQDLVPLLAIGHPP